MKKIIVLIGIVSCLSGCGKKIYTMEELTKNDKLREKILKECKIEDKNHDTQKCKNASEANDNKMIEIMEKMAE